MNELNNDKIKAATPTININILFSFLFEVIQFIPHPVKLLENPLVKPTGYRVYFVREKKKTALDKQR